MGDARIRTLERRWRETGSAEDHARYLTQRLRAGDLLEERLRLAAYLGDPAARAALGGDEPSEVPNQRDWADALHGWAGAVPARAALAAARTVLPVFDRGLNPDPRPRRALRAAETWVVCPCDAHSARALGAAETAEVMATDDAGTAVWAAVQAACGEDGASRRLLLSAVVAAGRVAGVVGVRAAVREALVPWALGYEDPLARRLTSAGSVTASSRPPRP